MKFQKQQLKRCKLSSIIIFLFIIMIGSFSVDNWSSKDELLIRKENTYQKIPFYQNNKISKDAASRSTPFSLLNSFQYEIHDPIWIGDNSEFSEFGFPGSGNSDDPFIIAGYSISDPFNQLIEIANVDLYFIIHNNKLDGKGGSEWHCGITLINTIHGTIENNNITDATNGIFLENSNNTLIFNNTITKNSAFAIGINEGCDNNTVKWNNFVENRIVNGFRYPQAYDVGLNNTFMYNYWDDWISPDMNTDGIVDNSYLVEEGNVDHSPLVYPHVFTEPSLLFPNGRETLNGTVEIQWTPSTDSFNHLITYSIYYSDNDGTSWNLLISELKATSYNWDTSALIDGTKYRIKVVASCSVGFTSEDISNDVFTLFNGSSAPIIVFPDSGEVLMGTTNIQWQSSIDITGMNVTYTISYSDDNGTSWIELFSDLTTFDCLWDTTSVPDGANYKIKVEEIYTSGIKASATSDGTFIIENMPSLITTILLPIPVIVMALGMLFWINRLIFRIIEEKMITNKE